VVLALDSCSGLQHWKMQYVKESKKVGVRPIFCAKFFVQDKCERLKIAL